MPAGEDEFRAGGLDPTIATPSGEEQGTARLEDPASSRLPPIPLPARVPSVPHYDIVGVIGEGGMGRVFKAIDRRLNRPVALKIIRGDDRLLIERFLREARAQARIEHEHVCKVYEAGESQGQPFIAMQLLEGRSLADTGLSLTLDQKVRVIRDAADALQAAHRLGLIHRDVKPANIIVHQVPDEPPRSWLVDFGLALDVSGEHEGLTVSGTTVGTPAYMSPEQVRGRSRDIDRRSDVYGLGATLYAALSGRAPFRGETPFDIVRKVLDEEPESLATAAPGTPPDLLTIVAKCMEKDPSRRYASARELCEDLTRFLEGEPIQARNASLTYRLVKKARKHRGVVGVACVAGMALAAMALTSVRTHLAAAERASVARRLGQEAERLEWMMRAATLAPLHDVRRERAAVRAALADLETQSNPRTRDAVAVALGRGHLALGDLRRARVFLEQAWSAGENGADVSVPLGTTLARLYIDELRDAERLADATLRAARKAELRDAYREPILRYLRAAREVQGSLPEQAEALIAATEGRDAEAVRLAQTASAKAPWLYEAVLIEGDVALAAGRRHRERAEYDRALERLQESAGLYARAASIGRSAASTHEAACAAWGELIYVEVELNPSRRPEQSYKSGVEACANARAIDPDSAAAYHHLSFVEWQWGYSQLLTGGDPGPALERAIAASASAQRLRPEWAEAHNYMGIAYGYLGRVAMGRGNDPRPMVRKAIASFDRAIDLTPSLAYAHATRGIGYSDLAKDAVTRGEDASASFDVAAASYRRATTLSPDWTMPRVSLVESLVARGTWESRVGRPCAATLETAVSEARSLLAVDAAPVARRLIAEANAARATCRR